MGIRQRLFVPFEDLWSDPKPEDKRPGAWFVGLVSGQRRLLRAAGADYNREVQALRDADPEVNAALWAHFQQQAEEVKAELAQMEPAGISATEDTAAPDAESALLEEASVMVEDATQNARLVQRNPRLNAIMALYGEIENANQAWVTRQLAICIKRLDGHMALVDPDFEGVPLETLWPPLNLADPDAALERRTLTLELISEEERQHLGAALNTFLAGGGGGLTKEQEGN